LTGKKGGSNGLVDMGAIPREDGPGTFVRRCLKRVEVRAAIGARAMVDPIAARGAGGAYRTAGGGGGRPTGRAAPPARRAAGEGGGARPSVPTVVIPQMTWSGKTEKKSKSDAGNCDSVGN